MARQRSSVQKIGSWDTGGVPYTAYFENAQKEKGINQNDSHENPDGKMGTGVVFHLNSDYSESAEKHPNEDYNGHWRHGRMDYSLSERNGSSSSAYALQQQNQHLRRASRGKSLTEVNNFLPSSPGHGRQSAHNPSDITDPTNRSALVPKFGAWDEKDPNAGEAFTVIFNKVKEEKQVAATKFPAAPPQPSKSMKTKKKTTRSKISCWLY